ncbi:MAG: PD40 domain-containing protein [Planctomycetota bacterium]|nr:MAG: PD40 domain-containing protein [Planctomycetota bacterium]
MIYIPKLSRKVPESVVFRGLIALLLVMSTVSTIHGQSAAPLTTYRGDDDEPCFSPDGRWIVYQSRDSSGRPDLWIVSSNGSVPQRITEGAGYN